MALQDDVHRLVRQHKTQIVRDGGRTDLASVQGLIHQLRQAKTSDHRAVKGPTSTGGRIPVALPAVMLMADVERTVAGWCSRLGITAHATLEGQLLACHNWAQEHGTPDAVASLTEQCSGWVNAITGMLNPQPRMDIRGSCPACQQTHVLEDGEDGGRVRNLALTAVGLTVSCRHCSSTWEGQQLYQLAGTLG